MPQSNLSTHGATTAASDAATGTRRAFIRIASHFETRLGEIGRYFAARSEPDRFDRLIDLLRERVVPQLACAPQAGRSLTDTRPPTHKEALDATLERDALASLTEGGAPSGSEVREHAFDDEQGSDYRLVYLDAGEAVYLLSIRRVAAPS
jgi:hypothetical protein